MAANIRMQHTIHTADKVVYFYDGEVEAKEGIVSVPRNRPEWVRRAFVLGYRLNPNTGEEYRLEDLNPEEFEVGE